MNPKVFIQLAFEHSCFVSTVEKMATLDIKFLSQTWLLAFGLCSIGNHPEPLLSKQLCVLRHTIESVWIVSIQAPI